MPQTIEKSEENVLFSMYNLLFDYLNYCDFLFDCSIREMGVTVSPYETDAKSEAKKIQHLVATVTPSIKEMKL